MGYIWDKILFEEEDEKLYIEMESMKHKVQAYRRFLTKKIREYYGIFKNTIDSSSDDSILHNLLFILESRSVSIGRERYKTTYTLEYNKNDIEEYMVTVIRDNIDNDPEIYKLRVIYKQGDDEYGIAECNLYPDAKVNDEDMPLTTYWIENIVHGERGYE